MNKINMKENCGSFKQFTEALWVTVSHFLLPYLLIINEEWRVVRIQSYIKVDRECLRDPALWDRDF